MVVQKYNWDYIEDSREFALGEIWTVRDELLSLLPADRVHGARENYYPSRTVVVIQNSEENTDPTYPVIRVVPLTSQVRFMREFDVELNPQLDSVKKTCIARVQLAQPILKNDLYQKVGDISQDKIYEILAVEMKLIGID